MKNVVRLISLTLVALFVFCACQQAEPETIPEYEMSMESGSADLDGAVISWGFAKGGEHEKDNTFGYINGTSFADMAIERRKSVENDLNCRFEMEYDGFSPIGNKLTASVISGSHCYDIVTNESFDNISKVKAGYFTGLSSYLDLRNTDKYGMPSMLTAVSYIDDVYCVVPYAWPELCYSSFGNPICVNENLIGQYGHTDPREYVENGKWTWDQLEECLLAYRMNDAGHDIYGMATHPPYFSMLMFLSNGVTFNEYTDEGIVCGLYTTAGIEAMERTKKIYRETCRECFAPFETNEAVSSCFKSGDCVLYPSGAAGIIGSASSIMYVMDNVGIIPFPQGPNATPGVYTSYYETFLYTTGIPVNTDIPEAAAMVIDRMFEPFDEYKTKEDIIEYLSEQVFFDPRDARVFVNMLEHTEYNYQNYGGRAAIEQVYGNNTITEMLESYRSYYDKMLEEAMIPHYQGRLAVYGE